MCVLLFGSLITQYGLAGGFSTESEKFLEFCVVEACQFNVPGDSRVLVPEHADVKLCVTGENILQSAVDHMEPEMDVPDGIVICGEGELVCQPVCYGAFQHGGIAVAGIEGVQVFAEVGLPLGAEGVRIDAGAQVVQLHLCAVPDVDAGGADGGVQQQEGDYHHYTYDKKAGVDGDVASLVMQETCSSAAVCVLQVVSGRAVLWRVPAVSGWIRSCQSK